MKWLTLLVVLSLACMTSTGVMASEATDSQEWTFEVTVEKFILAKDMDLIDWGSVCGPEFDWKSWMGGNQFYHAAYANCPFTVSVEGDNEAEDGVPVFAREEKDLEGDGLGRFDRLDTSWHIQVAVNGTRYPVGDPYWNLAGKRQYFAGGTLVTDGNIFYRNSSFNPSQTILDTPHNGDVQIRLYPRLNGPDADEEGDLGKLTGGPDGPQEWYESLDHGTYRAYLTFTYTAALE